MALPTGVLAQRSEHELRNLLEMYNARKRWCTATGDRAKAELLGHQIVDVENALAAKASATT